MQLYQPRQSNKLVCVFSDMDRHNIRKNRNLLLEVKAELEASGKLKRWNKYDTEALDEILIWAMHYDQGGKMQDFSEDQIDKVMKMVYKLMSVQDFNFFELFEIELDAGLDPNDEDTYMSDLDIRKEMDRRRSLQKTNKNIYSKLFEQFNRD